MPIRPIPYSAEERAAAIATVIDLLSKGKPLAEICRMDGMPSDDTIRNWGDEDESTARAIARAREAGEEVIAADCLAIADDGRNDFMQAMADEGDPKAAIVVLNGEHIQRSRLRVDTRLKLLAKWNPKKWGDKVDHNHGGSGQNGEIVHRVELVALK